MLTCAEILAYSYFCRFKWLLKADDDTFVRMDVLIPELDQVPPHEHDKLYWGYFDGRVSNLIIIIYSGPPVICEAEDPA